MVKSALHTPTILTTDARTSRDRPKTITSRPRSAREALPAGPGSATDSFGIGSFELVRQFVEHLAAKNPAAVLGNGHASRDPIDWAALEALVADSRSFEQAIGRAVVVADRMCRGVFDDTQFADSPSIGESPSHPVAVGPLSSPSAGGPLPSSGSEQPFFDFSNADVVPDFGDGSRYRAKVARKVARIFIGRRMTVTMIEDRAR